MTKSYTVLSQETGFAVTGNGEVLFTPGKLPLILPCKALATAIAAEWETHQKYNGMQMLMTTLAYTGIDRIRQQKAQVIEALMEYIDTDTLSYRATGSEKLSKRQEKEWAPVMKWAQRAFSRPWQTSTGVMPVEQAPETHADIKKMLQKMDAMRLSASCLLTSGYSSILLTLAVLNNRVSAVEAFRLSRLEEDSQSEAWGEDEEATRRAEALKAEIVIAERFLNLLDEP